MVSSLNSDAVALRGAHFGEGRGPIMMEGVYCEGDEKGLHRCFQSRSQPCSHSEDAAVQCSGLHDCISQHAYITCLSLFTMTTFQGHLQYQKTLVS